MNRVSGHAVPANVRVLAVRVARTRRRDAEFLEDVLDRVLDSVEGRALEPRDRALLTELVLGSCRRRVTLDYLIGKFSSRPLAKIQPELLEILRQATYQIVYLTRVPVHAAVAEAVNLAKGLSNASLPGFANAVLRALARAVKEKHEGVAEASLNDVLSSEDGWVCLEPGVLPDRAADPTEYLSVTGSMPRALVERWLRRWSSDEVRRILEVCNEVPAVFVHPNGLKTDVAALRAALAKEGRELLAGPSAGFFRLQSAEGLSKLEACEQGLFWVMDPAGARAVEALAPESGERVLDLCSAPGGKCALIAERMGNRGEVVAVDVSAERLGRLRENVLRLGLACVRPREHDGRRVTVEEEGRFDRALVDVPCSNTGVLARRVEARHRFREERLAELVRLQQELLCAALTVVRPGGIVVYSTCSIEAEENDEVVTAVRESSGPMEVQTCGTSLPEPNGADGGFVARIRKL